MGQQKMKARVIKVDQPSTSTKQIYDDPFKDLYSGEIIAPPYNLKELKLIGEYSTIIQQCVEAYKVNILGFGFIPKYRFDYNTDDTSNELKHLLIRNGPGLKNLFAILTMMKKLKRFLVLLLKIVRRWAMDMWKCYETH